MSDLDQDLEAFLAEPASEPRFHRLLDRATRGARFDVVASAWAAWAEALAQRDLRAEAARAFSTAASVHREDRADAAAADSAYRRALALEPLDRSALYGLALLLHAESGWSELVRLFRERAPRVDAAADGVVYHLYAAEVLEEQLDDPSSALDELVAALRAAPGDLSLVPRLMELAERSGRAQDAAVALGEMMIQAEEAEVRAALSYRLAQIHLGPLPQKDRALAYLRSALVELDEDPSRIADVEDAAMLREHLDPLEARFSDRAPHRRPPPQPVRLERELARMYERDHDHRRALMALTRALDHSPEDRELQEEVMRLGLIADDLDRVAETFERVVERTDNALLRSFLRLRLGHLYGQALRRPGEAVRVYTALLAEEPGHTEARRRLEPLLERLGRKTEQVALLEASLGTPAAPDRPRTLEKLERLYLHLGRSEDLERIEEQIRIETGDAAVVHPFADGDADPRSSDGVAPVSGFHLQPRIQQLEAALDSPSDAAARRAFVALTRVLIDEREDFEQAEAVAERGLERFPDEVALLELLEDVHRRQQRWDAVVTILRRRLEVADAVEVRLAVRKALAVLFEAKLDDRPRALEVLTRAEEEGPFDLGVSRERERLLLEAMDWPALRATLELRLREVEDARLAALTRASLARLAYEVDLDLERAWLLLEDASRDAPFEPDILELAAEVAARRRDLERAVALYQRLASLLDGPRAAAALVAAGRLNRDLGSDVDAAEAIFEAALAADPTSLPAVEALAELAAERRDWSRALAWRVRAAELSAEPQPRADHLAEAARIAEEELGDARRACDLYRGTFEVDPERVELGARAARLASPWDPAEAHRLFRDAGRRASEDARSAEWLEQAAEAAERAGDPAAAVTSYREALWYEPRRRRALARLAELLEAEEAWDEVHDLAGRYLLWHEAAGTDAERASAYLRMARAKAALGEWSAAARFAGRSVEIEPTLGAYQRLAAALEREERWLEAGAAHQRAADLADDETRLAALTRAATLYGEHDAPARAAVVWAEALELRPHDAGIAEQLARARYRAGDPLGASDAHRLRAEHLRGAPRAAALRTAATWAWSQNRRAAAELSKAALDVDLSGEAAFDLARLWEYDGDVERVAPLLLAVGKVHAAAGRAPVAARVLAEAAQLASLRSFDGARATEAIEAVRALEPERPWTIRRAWVLDRRAEAREVPADRAARGWLDVLGQHPGHALALQRLERWLFRAERPQPAAFVRGLRDDNADAAPLLTDPPGPGPALPEPCDPLSRFWTEHGALLLDQLRDGWRGAAPRRRLDLDAAPEALGVALHRARGRLGLEADATPVYAVESRDAAVVPLWVDGAPALGVDVPWAASLSAADLGFQLGFALGSACPAALPWTALERTAVLETLLGLTSEWPADAPFDERRASRRARAVERGLSEEARASLRAATADWGAAVRAAVAQARARAVAAGLVACLSWSTVRRSAFTMQLGPRRSWWPLVLRFATGQPFLGWACGLSGPSDVEERSIESVG